MRLHHFLFVLHFSDAEVSRYQTCLGGHKVLQDFNSYRLWNMYTMERTALKKYGIRTFGSFLIGLMVCVSSIRCAPSKQGRVCSSASDCLSGEHCTDGLCQTSKPKTEVEAAERDNTETLEDRDAGTVQEKKDPSDCSKQEDCQKGFVCINGRCNTCPKECTTGQKRCAKKGIQSCVELHGCKQWGTSIQPCESGKICTSGTCTPGCSDDQDCPKGTICSKGTCGTWCFEDKECTKGYRCIDQKCTTSCTSDTQCQTNLNYRCRGGKCIEVIPPRPCKSSADCTSEEVCSLKGFCVEHCTSVAECKQGELCQQGKCVAGQRCTIKSEFLCANGFRCSKATSGICYTHCKGKGDSLCRNHFACIDHKCRTSCTSDTDCSSGAYCETKTGTCKKGCNKDSQCKGFLCAKDTIKQCYENCVSNQECAPGYVCNKKYRTCTPQCSQDSDCKKTGDICEEGICSFPGAQVAEVDQPCNRVSVCKPGYACINIGMNSVETVCKKKCSQQSDCSNSSFKCMETPATGGNRDKVCWGTCTSYCGLTRTCHRSICRGAERKPAGSLKAWQACTYHEECGKNMRCMIFSLRKAPLGNRMILTKMCQPRCLPFNRCAPGYICRGHRIKTKDRTQACFKSCTSSTDCKLSDPFATRLFCSTKERICVRN